MTPTEHDHSTRRPRICHQRKQNSNCLSNRRIESPATATRSITPSGIPVNEAADHPSTKDRHRKSEFEQMLRFAGSRALPIRAARNQTSAEG